ncbi:MAG: hypothetical protein JSU98_13475 [Gemmatimonadales bacterium]|nr:MAG: hypothetical protein JSU98_13475 [Gemmatimonadales bacterium]
MGRQVLMAGIAIVLAAAPALAQQGPEKRTGRGGGPPAAGVERNVDAALARAEALGLDDATIQALREMRTELQALDDDFRGRVREFRQQARDRDVEAREARRAEMRARQEEARGLRQERSEALAPFQERYETLLSTEVRAELRQSVRRDQRPRAGRRPAGSRNDLRAGVGRPGIGVARGPIARWGRGGFVGPARAEAARRARLRMIRRRDIP